IDDLRSDLSGRIEKDSAIRSSLQLSLANALRAEDAACNSVRDKSDRDGGLRQLASQPRQPRSITGGAQWQRHNGRDDDRLRQLYGSQTARSPHNQNRPAFV